MKPLSGSQDNGMEENRDNVSVQERTSDRNFHRRARYAQMSPERKELFLSQLREKRLNRKDKNSFINQIVLALLQSSLLRFLLNMLKLPNVQTYQLLQLEQNV